MKKYVKILAMLSLAVSFLYLACSDKSTNNELTEGNYGDEDYLYAKQDAELTIAEMNYDDQEVCDWIAWNPRHVAVDSVSYDSTTGWHLRAGVFDSDYLQISLADSFRFSNLDSAYQFRPDSTTNIFERRLKKSFLLTASPESLGTYWLKTRNRNTDWAGLADSVTTLNGNFHRHWEGLSDYRSFTRTVEGTLDNVKFYTADLENGRPTYPFSGTFNGSLVQDFQGPMHHIHLEGTLTVIFRLEDGRYCYHARLVRGDNWWEWDNCFPDSL